MTPNCIRKGGEIGLFNADFVMQFSNKLEKEFWFIFKLQELYHVLWLLYLLIYYGSTPSIEDIKK